MRVIKSFVGVAFVFCVYLGASKYGMPYIGIRMYLRTRELTSHCVGLFQILMVVCGTPRCITYGEVAGHLSRKLLMVTLLTLAGPKCF
jgi:hypothetical protein